MTKLRIIVSVAVIAALTGGIFFLSASKKNGTVANTQSYELTTIGNGSIESLVSSSGTLSVVSSVSVLAQMSGRIEKVNVGFNESVKRGQVLATINTDLLKLQAKVAQAAVDKANASYELQRLSLQNATALSAKGLLSDYDLKSSQSSLDVLKAELSSAQASLEQIETEITQYAIITSPIDGVVLERDVDAGQSVVGGSGSTSTSLFTIAGDLAKMQIKAQVDELDIGAIKIGQDVRFSVEASTGTTFTGKVKEIRLVPETSDNVVYYDVIILANNDSGKLLPGMTASVNFIKQKKDGILVVPSAALRFTPTSLSAAETKKALYLAALGNLSTTEKEAASLKYDEELKAAAAAGAEAKKTSGLASLVGGNGGFGGPPGAKSGSSASSTQVAATSSAAVKKALWYLDGSGKLAATMVEIGVSDSTNTELVGAEALSGKSVILKVKVE
jgi:HlyD family secretion protein